MIGLTKNERRILKALQQYEYKSDFCYDDLKTHLGNLDEIRFEYCCEYMAENRNLLKIVGNTGGKLFVRLTYVGFFYKEFRYQRIKEFLLTSIFTPIAVSSIVAFITVLLSFIY